MAIAASAILESSRCIISLREEMEKEELKGKGRGGEEREEEEERKQRSTKIYHPGE